MSGPLSVAGFKPKTARLAREFGRLFNLWPPMKSGKSVAMRNKWEQWLEENTVTWDGEEIPIDDVLNYWRRIEQGSDFTISTPASTIKTVRAMHARSKRPGNRARLVRPGEE